MRRMKVLTVVLAAFVLTGCDAMGRNEKGNSDHPPQDRPPASSEGFISAQNWNAWVNRQPPGPARLIVIGEVTVASLGHHAKLIPDVKKDPQPDDTLRLRIVITRQEGMAGQALTTREVRFESVEKTNVKRIEITDPKGQTHQIDDIKSAH